MNKAIPFNSVEEFRKEATLLTKQFKSLKLSTIKSAISKRHGFSDTRAFESFISSKSSNSFLSEKVYPYAECNTDKTVSLFKRVPLPSGSNVKTMSKDDIVLALAHNTSLPVYADSTQSIESLIQGLQPYAETFKVKNDPNNEEQIIIEVTVELESKDLRNTEFNPLIYIILNDNQSTEYPSLDDKDSTINISESQCPFYLLFNIVFNEIKKIFYDDNIYNTNLVGRVHEHTCYEIYKYWEALNIENSHPHFKNYLKKHGSTIELIRDIYHQVLSMFSLSLIKEQKEYCSYDYGKTLADNISEVCDNVNIDNSAFITVLSSLQLTYVDPNK
tara:strand:+ start:252 stop:1244 length:993 start_codon:yes stop_codon:yes gene_type:complete